MFLKIAADPGAVTTATNAGHDPMLSQVAALVAALHHTWEIDRVDSDDSDDSVSLLVTPAQHDESDTGFLVEIAGHRLALSVLRDDKLEFFGSYCSAKTVVSACVARWTTCMADNLSPVE